MTDTHKGSSIGPAIAGAAFGAAVAAGAVILSDQKKRKQVMKQMNTVKGKATDMLQQAKSKMHEMQSKASDTMSNVEDSAMDYLDEDDMDKKNPTTSRRIH